MTKARRYNTGKLRHELIPSFFKEELAKVYTIGAEKYDIYNEEGKLVESGADNWKKGLEWRSVLASVYRHLNAFDSGEDFDFGYPQELLDKYGPTYHLSNAAWGISVLMEFYKIHPELDNRSIQKLRPAKIAFDIDEICCAFCKGWFDRHGGIEIPNAWNYDRLVLERLDLAKDDKEFWLSLPTIINPNDIPIEPSAYISHRNIDVSVTEEWLDINHFPVAPVIHVKKSTEKVGICKELGIEIMVEDNYNTFKQFRNEGMACYLFDRPHNQRFKDVGHWRIKDIKDLPVYRYSF